MAFKCFESHRLKFPFDFSVPLQIKSMFGRYEDIGRLGKAFFIEPEKFPEKPFYPVPFYCPADFTADSQAESSYAEIVCF